MSRKRILYLSHTQQIGGAEVLLRTLVKFIDKTKYEPIVLFPSSSTPGPLRKQIEDLGVQTLDGPLEWWIRRESDRLFHEMPLLERVSRIRKMIEEIKPDIVHTNTSVICEGAFAAKLAGVPHVWHVLERLDQHPTLHSLIPLPEVYEIMDATSRRVPVVSNKLRASLESSFAPGKVQTIWLGIDDSKIVNAKAAPIREELAIPADQVLCVSVGGLLPEKGFDVLVESAVYLKKMQAKVHLLIIGSGRPSAINALNRQIAAAGVGDVVHYLGYRQEAPEIVKAADIFVLPSRSDAFPLTVLEAMATGTPVIATDCGGPAEMLQEGQAGVIVTVGDPEALANAIHKLSETPEGRRKYADAAKLRYDENFRADLFAKRCEGLYVEMLNEAHPQTSATDNEMVLQAINQYQELYNQALSDGAAQSPIGWRIKQIRRHVGRAALDWKSRSQH